MTAQVRYGGASAQLHADKAYDIAGRPRCAAEESFPPPLLPVGLDTG